MSQPARLAPALVLPMVGGRTFDLYRDGGPQGTLLAFYRGRHCPFCWKALAALESRIDDFEAMGYRAVAVSTDGPEDARATVGKARLKDLPVCHSLPIGLAEGWGLAISEGVEGTDEPPLFSEPGYFLVLPGGTIWAAWLLTSPFGRPGLDDILDAIRLQRRGLYAMHNGWPGLAPPPPARPAVRPAPPRLTAV